MKKSLKAMIASATLLLATSVLAGCNKEPMIPVASVHEHTFSEAWEASDSSHWHKATCEHTDLMSGVEDHKFGGWNVRTEPTQTAEGLQYRTCSVCNYEQTAAIAKLDHQHVFSQAWEADDENHWHKATCHVNVFSNFEGHTYGEWSLDVEPTETTKGLKKRTCSVCGHVQSAEVDKSLHVHTYATEWSMSKEAHWHAATCEHASEGVRSNYGVHAFTEWTVATPSTETTKGLKYRTCDVCGYREEEELPLAEHVHTFANEYSSNEVEHWYAATCGHDNVRDAVEAHTWGEWNTEVQSTETVHGRRWRKCIECDYIQNEELPLANHVHTYSNEWSKNATEHWHAATCGHDDSRKDVGEHSFGAWTVDNASTCCNQGTKHRVCSVCGYVENAAAELNNDAHSFASAWTYDENTHWHAATCGHAVKGSEAAHNMRSNANYPTWNDARTCTTCGYIAQPAGKNTTQSIPADYVTIPQNSRTYYTFTLQCDSQIRLDFIMADKANCQAIAYVYDANGALAGINGSYIRNAPLTTSRTAPAGQYFLLIANTQSGNTEFDVLIHNFTYVYNKSELDTMEITADGVTATYTMYEYQPKYGVNTNITYYSVENEAGDELQLFNEYSLYNQPNLYDHGAIRYRNKAGNYIYVYVPRFIYRSSVITSSPYTISSRNEDNVKLTLTMENYYKVIKADPSFSKRTNSRFNSYTELDAQLVAWYSSFMSVFTPSYWSYKDGAYSCRYNYFPFFAADDAEYNIEANCVDLNYDTDKEIYVAKNPKYGYNGYKLTNTTQASFSRFVCYSTDDNFNNLISRSSTANSVFIIDDNGYDITEEYYSKTMNSDSTVDAYSYKYSRDDATDIFEVQPGETYYLFEKYFVGTAYRFGMDQTRYSIMIDPNYDDNEPITFVSSTLAEGAHYEEEFDVEDIDDALYNEYNDPEGKTLVGYSMTANGQVRYIDDPKGSFSTFTHTAKMDATLYAQWINVENIVTTFRAMKNYNYDDSTHIMRYYLNSFIDPDMVVKKDDALSYIYANGYVAEFMVAGVGWSDTYQSELTQSLINTNSSDNPFIDVAIPNLSGCHALGGPLLAIEMKQAFAVSYLNPDGDISDLEIADKGDSVAMPLANILGYSIYDSGEYFAGWDGNGDGVIDVLDGGNYTPIRDTILEPVYRTIDGSNVVALQYDIEFVEIGGVEYLKLEVLDPSLTITTSTHFILMFNDTSTEEIGVTQILNVNGVNLPSGATNADGEILLNVFNLQAKKDLILSANLILAA